MTIAPTAGGIVLGEGGTIALVQSHHRDMWLFPKGNLEANETPEEGARREIEEETGLTNLELIADLGEYSRPRIEDPTVLKVIHMYLFAAPAGSIPMPRMEVTATKWFPFREVPGAIGNVQDRAWFVSVFDRVREAIQRD